MVAAVITTGNHPKALWPGIKAWWGRSYGEHPEEWKEIFDTEDSDKAYEEDVELTGFGLAGVKNQGEAISFDSESQGAVKRYTHVVYGLGYIVTREELEDNQYEKVSRRRSKALAISLRQTEEIVGANILNRAFNTSYTGGDGKALIVSDHPSLIGSQSNVLTTAADLSEASLEDMTIQVMQWTNSRGLKFAFKTRKLIVSPNDAFNAERIVKTPKTLGTNNNDINALRSMGVLPEGYCVNHYLTDTDAWFVKTNAPEGLKRYNRRAAEFKQDNDFDTENAKAKSTIRFSVGWTDWRGMAGSPGA